MCQFKDTRWMSAVQKEKILKLWICFLKNNFKRNDFTKDLYHYLMGRCGFIAHYDIHGFYSEYFATGADKIRFLKHFDINKMRGNHFCELPLDGDCGDINRMLVTEAAKYLPVLYAGASAEQKCLDLRLVEKLLARQQSGSGKRRATG